MPSSGRLVGSPSIEEAVDMDNVSDEALRAEFQPILRRELDELARSSEGTAGDRAPVQLDQQRVDRLARIDAMQVQAMAAATERRRQSRGARVRAALKRMDEGEFGYCLRCGEFIGLGRLRVDPTLTRCTECAGQGA